MNNKFFIKDGIPTVNPENVTALTSFQIIDVRMPDEYTGELGHIKNSQLVTLGPELTTFLATLEKSKKIIFVCRSGVRSGRATQEALLAGFKDAYNMDGGMLKWNSLGLSPKLK